MAATGRKTRCIGGAEHPVGSLWGSGLVRRHKMFFRGSNIELASGEYERMFRGSGQDIRSEWE